MNQTTFFFCDCGYEKALNEGDDFIILQCGNCNTLNSVENKIKYYTKCHACSNLEEVNEGENLSIEKECSNCRLKGKVGFIDFSKDVLFELENKVECEEKCERCNKINWLEPLENSYRCPNCYSYLRQKMSNMWD